MSAEDRFRRMLRWYPRSWRHDNGAVVLGTLLDRADDEGRSAPTATERSSAALHGSAAHLTGRVAIVVATAAVALGALCGAAMVWGAAPLVPTAFTVLNAAGIPVLLTIALTAAARARGWISDGAALAACAVGTSAVVLGALAQIGWSQSFDAADAGRPATWLGAAMWVLALSGIATGTAAIALTTASALRSALPACALRAFVSTVLGLIGAITIAWVLFVPMTAGILSVGALWFAVRTRRPRAEPHDSARESSPASPVRRSGVSWAPFRPQGTASVLEAISLAVGIFGVIEMAMDLRALPAGIAISNDAVVRGIVILLVSAIPLLAAIGIRRTAGARLRGRHVWPPIALAAAAVVGIAHAYLFSPEWSAMLPSLQAAAIVGGAAIAWWIIPRTGGAIGFAVGITYAFPLGVVIAPALAVAAPVYAILSIGLSVRRARRSAT